MFQVFKENGRTIKSYGFFDMDGLNTFLDHYWKIKELIYETKKYPIKNGNYFIDTGFYIKEIVYVRDGIPLISHRLKIV
jgi:hypothetical protein